MRIGNTLYLDHQASTPVDSRVFEAMVPFFTESFANPHSADHSLGWASAQAVDDAAALVAALVGADADEIIFTSGATEANNLALLGLGTGETNAPARKTILVGEIDHKSALAAADALRPLGFRVERIRALRDGHLDLADLERKAGKGCLLVSICLVNSEIGTIQKVADVSGLAQRHGFVLHLDASQAPCALDLTSCAAMADMISFSGHKMYGPKGIGALYIRRDIQRRVRPLIHGGGQQSNLRSGTLPTPLCVGLGAAAKLLRGDEAATERDRITKRRDRLVSRLMARPWEVLLNGPALASRHPGNANLRFNGFAAQEVLASLQPRLAASTGSACSSGVIGPSHVLLGIGLSDEEAGSSIRFSVGRHTREEDVDAAAELVRETLERLAAAGLYRDREKTPLVRELAT